MQFAIATSVSAGGEMDVRELATVAHLISSLVDRPDGIGGDEPAGRPVPTLARWADTDYIYFEAELPEGTDMEADVSVHDSRVFIRVAK